MQTRLRTTAGILAIALVSACGGGGGGNAVPASGVLPPAPIASAPPVPSATTTTVAISIPDGAEASVETALRRSAASTGKAPAYVSPSTSGVSILAKVHGTGTVAGTTVADVSSGSPNCAIVGSQRTCTVGVTLPAGNYDFTLTLYDQKPVSGAIPVGANALGISTMTQAVVLHQANSLSFYVGGIVGSISSTAFSSLPADGAQHTYAMAVTALDADGNAIVSQTNNNPYAVPITVTLNEAGGSGHSHLLLNGTNVGTSATLMKASDTLALVYDGGGSAGYTTQTSLASGGAAQSVRVSPMYVTGSFTTTDAGQQATTAISEVGAPAGVTYGSGWSCAGFSQNVSGSGASATAAVTAPSAVVGGALSASYACPNVTVTDSLGTSVAKPVAATIPLNPECASLASSHYIGTKTGSSYDVGQGSPCGLSAPSTLTLYNGPDDGSHPNAASAGVSEIRNQSTMTTDASGCASKASLTSGSTIAGAAVPSGTASGTIGIKAAFTANVTCNLQVADGNGAVHPVTVSILPSVTTVNGTDTEDPSCTNPFADDYECTVSASVYIGLSAGGQYLAMATDSIYLDAHVVVDDETRFGSGRGPTPILLHSCSGATAPYNPCTTYTIASDSADFDGSILLPAGTSGHYWLSSGLNGGSGGNPEADSGSVTITVNGYLYSLANGTGALHPSATVKRPAAASRKT